MAKNNYFEFKQFRIEQNNAAMRVGTDGVLLGTWTNTANVNSVLDIGTGTGLVALMMAQRTVAKIHAIDIDESAITDARYNFEHSKWNSRLTVEQISAQNYALRTAQKFDCIVCNPPFFNNSPKSQEKSRMIARHTDTLLFSDLIKSAAQLLTPNGTFNVVIPSDQETAFRNYANEERLFATRITHIKPNPVKPIKRVLIEFQTEGELIDENELILETETHHIYTPEAIKLFKDFYLKL